MRGFPQVLSTKEDYMNCMEAWPDETRAALRQLLADRFVWKEAGELAEGEDGMEDASHMVVAKEGSEGAGLPVRVQMELAADPNARVYRLGFTDGEIEELLG